MTIDSVGRQLREQLRERVDARGLATAPRTERRVRVREEALELLRASGAILPQRELTRMVNEVSDEVVGFGPIEFLLKDPDVTEVMVNGPDDVYVEREGRIERAPDGLFEGEEAVLHLIERIVGPLGLRVDESSPWADARLPEGSAVSTRSCRLSRSAVPRSRSASSRRSRSRPTTWSRTAASGPRMLRFLAACVRGRANVIVSGRRRQRARPRCSGSCRVHPRRRAADHDRGRRRAATGETARGRARGAPGQRRGQGRGDGSRPGPQRAAHATRPHHRRRGPRRRGARHAPGDEHRARGVAVDRARELHAAPALAAGDDGDDVRCRSARRPHPHPGRVGHRRDRASRAAARRPAGRLGDRRRRRHPSRRAGGDAAVPVPAEGRRGRCVSKRRARSPRSPPRSPIRGEPVGTGSSRRGSIDDRGSR